MRAGLNNLCSKLSSCCCFRRCIFCAAGVHGCERNCAKQAQQHALACWLFASTPADNLRGPAAGRVQLACRKQQSHSVLPPSCRVPSEQTVSECTQTRLAVSHPVCSDSRQRGSSCVDARQKPRLSPLSLVMSLRADSTTSNAPSAGWGALQLRLLPACRVCYRWRRCGCFRLPSSTSYCRAAAKAASMWRI